MYSKVADNQVVTGTEGHYSQAVPMNGGNAVAVDAVCLYYGEVAITVQLQGSNELENWEDISGASITLDDIEDGAVTETGIAYRYVRLKYSNASSATSVLTAGINVASL